MARYDFAPHGLEHGSSTPRRLRRLIFAVLLTLLAVGQGVDAQREGADTDEPRRFVAMAAMRDGVKLAADVYLPEGDGPWPAVVTRTPYNRKSCERQGREFVGARL